MRATNRLIATALSLVLVVLLVLVAIEIALARMNRGSITPWERWYKTIDATTWDASGTRVVFGVLAGVGVVLLFLQVWRRRPVVLALDDRSEFAPATVRRRHLERALSSDSSQLDGVASARVKAKRRRVEVGARTNRINPGDLEEQLHSTVDSRVSSLGLTEALPVTVDLEHREQPNVDKGGRVQ